MNPAKTLHPPPPLPPTYLMYGPLVIKPVKITYKTYILVNHAVDVNWLVHVSTIDIISTI